MIAITDEDVSFAARTLQCEFGDEHAKFLKASGACDLHAGPGSGKTTLRVAKLAIIAKKWPWRDRGVLVLSHTNVARSEVEHRLVREPAGARLLTYPHFIGTIQGFVDRFLALPLLRERGIVDARVDDELFGHLAAVRFYGTKQYPKVLPISGNRRRMTRSRDHEGARPAVTPRSAIKFIAAPADAARRSSAGSWTPSPLGPPSCACARRHVRVVVLRLRAVGSCRRRWSRSRTCA